MGWWSAPENPDILVGDAVQHGADFFRPAVHTSKTCCASRALQQREYVLILTFKINIDHGIYSEVSGIGIRKMTLKTARRTQERIRQRTSSRPTLPFIPRAATAP